MNNDNYSSSLYSLFSDTIGIENVQQNTPPTLCGTFLSKSQTALVLNPTSINQIIASLEIAKTNGVHLYPVSTGKNLGYGSSSPVKSNNIVLNLSRLKKITNYDHDLGIVTLEPGVTQRQLADYLSSKGGKFWMDCSGASSNCSIVGNTLDRGFGYSPYSNHAKHIISMEIVLPSGEIINTGHGRFKNAHSAHTYQAGVGPSVDGLFIQSNLGIITKITISLMLKPEYFEAYFFKINNDSKLPQLIDDLGHLRKTGCVQSAVHIGNNFRVLPAFMQYPWEEANNVTPLPENLRQKYQKQYDIGAWNGSGAIYGTKKEVKLLKKQIKSALSHSVDQLRFINDTKLKFANLINNALPNKKDRQLNRLLRILNPIYGIMKGEPADSVFSACYWRKKTPPPTNMDPDRDKCGLIWLSPVAPLTGDNAQKMYFMAKSILQKYGYEPAMTLTLIDEINIENIISITYDREASEDVNALNCYYELERTLAESGYYPYRLGIHAMDSTLNRSDNNYNDLLRKIKQAIDPDNIISPGRYII